MWYGRVCGGSKIVAKPSESPDWRFFFQYGVGNELCVVFGPVMKRNDVARLAEWVERKMSG